MKKKYKVHIDEVYCKDIVVEAESENEAKNIAEEVACNDTIMLNDEYFAERKIEVSEEFPSIEIKNDKLYKFIKNCCRRSHIPDLHSFVINVSGGRAFVECGRCLVSVDVFYDDFSPDETEQFTGKPEYVTQKLNELKADYNSIEM